MRKLILELVMRIISPMLEKYEKEYLEKLDSKHNRFKSSYHEHMDLITAKWNSEQHIELELSNLLDKSILSDVFIIRVVNEINKRQLIK